MSATGRCTVLIVDDEPPARRKVRRFLAADPEVDVVGEAGSGPDAVRAIRELRPDLVVLDVQMPGMDGFAVLEALAAELPEVVFATAYDQHALRAFEVGAVDYLLKPFDATRFRTALARAKERVRSGREGALTERLRVLLDAVRVPAGTGVKRPASGLGDAAAGVAPAPLPTATPQPPGAPPLERILVEERGRGVFVALERVDWIAAEGNYVMLHVGAARHLVRASLAALEERLDPRRFVRVHRSAIVNLDRVAELRPEGRGDHTLVLTTGARIPLSRRYRARLPHLFEPGL